MGLIWQMNPMWTLYLSLSSLHKVIWVLCVFISPRYMMSQTRNGFHTYFLSWSSIFLFCILIIYLTVTLTLYIVGCCCSRAMCATRTKLPSSDCRCSPLIDPSCASRAWRNTQSFTTAKTSLTCWPTWGF